MGFYKKAFSKILIPYWIFLLFVVVIQKIIIPEVFSWGRAIQAFLCVGLLDGAEHLWFVQTILICYLLLPLLLQLKAQIIYFSPQKATIWFLIVFILIQFVGFSFDGYYMFPNRITCFAVGIALSGVWQKEKTLLKQAVVFSVMAIVMNVARVFLLQYKVGSSNLLIPLFVKYAHGVLGIAVFLVLHELLFHIKGNVVLRFSDQYSYYIYLVHQVFILGPLSLMELTTNKVLNITIICCCIFVAGFLLKKISDFTKEKIEKIKLVSCLS